MKPLRGTLGGRVGACHGHVWFTPRVLESLVTRRTAGTLPILAVDDAALSKWRRAQSAATKRWLKASAFEAKGNRVLLVPGKTGPALALLGRSDESLWTWAAAAQRLAPGRYRIDGDLDSEAANDAATGWALEAYRYDAFVTKKHEVKRKLVWPANADRDEVSRLVTVWGAVRDRINAPAASLGPQDLVEIAKGLDAKVRVVSGKRLRDEFPAIDAVGRGSGRKPRLIDLTWGARDLPSVTLVGKGVCFDSGGLNLKTTAGMLLMKKDMGGAAIVLGLAELIIGAGLPVRLRVIVPAVENLPGADAYRPSDVISTRAGKSVEITNTDAEGRVILADALTLACEDEPELLIDVATLTGSARFAIGTEITPFWTKQRKLADEIERAGREERDLMWRLPLHAGYRRHLDSRVADLKNAATTHQGGSILATLFLKEFVDKVGDWVHLDVFAWNDYARPGRPVGGEATGLRALWRFLKERYAPASESDGASESDRG